MRKLFITLVICSASYTMQAQTTYTYLQAADTYFNNSDYASAAVYYEKYLGAGKKSAPAAGFSPYSTSLSFAKTTVIKGAGAKALYQLAESYRLLNNPSKAAPLYKEVISKYGNEFPLAQYHYGSALIAEKKFDEAERSLQSFLDGYKETDVYSEDARRKIQSIRFIMKQLSKENLDLYSVEPLTAINAAEGANYAPVLTAGNKLLFTSTRIESNDTRHINRIYEGDYTAGNTTPVLSKINQPNDAQQGIAAVSPDGNTIYLTRWNIINGKKSAAIYTSKKNGQEWSEPVAMGKDVNVAGYSSLQPFVMPDGKHLLFASNRPGGEGGFDLWLTTLAGGQPVNLGKTINTAADEEAAYYHAGSGSLVFSSNGRIGMGGFDFFQSKGVPGNWSTAVNMGYPVNSVKDDLYFISKSKGNNILEEVLLSSDRASACCLQLFSIKKKTVQKQVSGKVISCVTNEVIEGATVTITDIKTGTVITKTTGANGLYSFTVDEYSSMKAEAVAAGYEKTGLVVGASGEETALTLEYPAICLAKTKECPPAAAVPEAGAIVVIDNVYFGFNKADLKPESYPALDKLVSMLNENPGMTIEIRGHTDNKGDNFYNEQLSQRRSQACVDYLVSKGIIKERLSANGYGSRLPVEVNQNPDGSDNPEGRTKNRRTEFKVVRK
jgi:OOP family OmpA-OmpF porin